MRAATFWLKDDQQDIADLSDAVEGYRRACYLLGRTRGPLAAFYSNTWHQQGAKGY